MRAIIDRRPIGLPKLSQFDANLPLATWIAKPESDFAIVVYPWTPDNTIFHTPYYYKHVYGYEVDGMDDTLGRVEDSARAILYSASKQWLENIAGLGIIAHGMCTLVDPQLDDTEDMHMQLLIYLVDLLKTVRGTSLSKIP
jgi:hypothetical protein